MDQEYILFGLFSYTGCSPELIKKSPIYDPVACNGLTRFWELEQVGRIQDSNENNSNQSALDNYYNSIEYSPEDKKYSVNLLWKPERKPFLKLNYAQTYKRLTNNLTRLRKNNDIFMQYNTAIMEYVEKGFAHPVNVN